MEVDSPQTLRAQSSQIGDADVEVQPYERSKYFPAGRDSPKVKEFRASSAGPSGDFSATGGRTVQDSSNKKAWQQRDVIDLTRDGDVMESMDVDARAEEQDERFLNLLSNTGGANTPVAPFYGNLTDNPLQATLRFSQLIHPQPLQNHQKDTHNTPKSSGNRAIGSSQLAGITERLWDRADIIQPLDTRNARPRREYDPDTIARDLRCVFGFDRTRPGLNYHLRNLKLAFKAVDDHSDLSTFRWDLVESCVDMPPAIPYDDLNHGGQSFPVRSPAGPPIAAQASNDQNFLDQSFPPALGGREVSTPGAFVPSFTVHPGPSLNQSPYAHTPYGPTPHPPSSANGFYALNDVSHQRNQQVNAQSSVFRLDQKPNDQRQLLPTLSKPDQPSQVPDVTAPGTFGHYAVPAQPVLSEYHSSQAPLISSHPPSQLHGHQPAPSRSRYPPPQSPSPSSDSPGQRKVSAKSVPPTNGRGTPPLFRFTKEQRAILEKEARINMYPAMPLKLRLAQEIGVDVKKVSQFFSNAQAGNYAFAKLLKAAGLAKPPSPDDEGGSTSGHPIARTSYSSSPAPASIHRRGRPQGSKNRTALAVVLDSATSTPVNFAPGRLPSYASSLSASPAPTFPVKKKQGRPFKTAEAAAKAAAKAARRETGVAKKRGRPFKIRHQLNISAPEPNFYSFDCEWMGCEAELQNLETLKLHIKVVHRKRNSDGLLECRWGNCCGEKQVLGLMEPHGKEFKSKEKWAEHVHEHTNRFAWHLGDGPKGTDLSVAATETEIDAQPDWLKDPVTGKLVTPSVENQAIEGGRPKKNSRKRFVREDDSDGVNQVLVPIKNPEEYTKVNFDEDDEESSTTEDDEEEDDAMDVDELS